MRCGSRLYTLKEAVNKKHIYILPACTERLLKKRGTGLGTNCVSALIGITFPVFKRFMDQFQSLPFSNCNNSRIHHLQQSLFACFAAADLVAGMFTASINKVSA